MFRSLPQLEAYYWVARLGSFRAAAERLWLTQPSISIRIRELEAEAPLPQRQEEASKRKRAERCLHEAVAVSA